MFRQYRFRDYRFSLILWVVVLSVIGIMVIGSAQESYQARQIAGLGIGITVMLVLSLIDYTWILRFTWIYYTAGVILLTAVLLVGERVNNATRWIKIGIQFQPSDLMKIVLILFFAQFFAAREDHLNSLQVIIGSLALLGIPLLLIVREPDLSTTIVTGLTYCAIIFSAGLCL